MSQSVQIIERIHRVNGVVQPQRVLIPTMDMLSEKIRLVPSGSFRAIKEIQAELAREHGADVTCPVTVQRLLKVIAVIAHSAVTLRDPAAVPFWRVVEDGERLAGGRGFIIAQQAKERAR